MNQNMICTLVILVMAIFFFPYAIKTFHRDIYRNAYRLTHSCKIFIEGVERDIETEASITGVFDKITFDKVQKYKEEIHEINMECLKYCYEPVSKLPKDKTHARELLNKVNIIRNDLIEIVTK